MKTILTDLDGTLIFQDNQKYLTSKSKFEIIPGTLNQLINWQTKGYRLILTTARKESARKITEEMLSELGIFYDFLITGLPTGPRILINDLKPGKENIPMAIAINLPRNKGIADIDI